VRVNKEEMKILNKSINDAYNLKSHKNIITNSTYINLKKICLVSHYLKLHSLHSADNAICVKQHSDQIHFKSP